MLPHAGRAHGLVAGALREAKWQRRLAAVRSKQAAGRRFHYLGHLRKNAEKMVLDY